MSVNPAPIKSLLRERKRTPLFNRINLWTICDEVAVGVDLQMSAGLELSGLPDIATRTDEEAESYLTLVRRLLHSVPENTTLQFVLQSRTGDPERIEEFLKLNQNKGSLGEFAEPLLAAKTKFLSEKFIQRRSLFLFITTYPQGEMPQVRLTSLMEKSPKAMTSENHRTRVKELHAITDGVMDSLLSLKADARRLTDKELANYFYRHLNPQRSLVLPCPEIAPRPKGSQSLTARSVLALSASESFFDHFTIDGQHYRAVNMLFLPESVVIGNLSTLLGELWPDCDLGLTIHCVNSERMIDKLKRSANITKALSFSNFGSRYEAEQKYAELDEMIREIRSTSQRVFTFSFSLLFRDRDLNALESNAAIGMKSFQNIGSSQGIVDNLNHEDLYLSFLPNHSHLNPRNHVIHTDPLANLLPLTASWKGTREPRVLLENPEGELINMDLFDSSLPSKHSLLIGSTGSGKSFTTNYLLTNFLIESEKNHIVIIDIGGSYRKLCQIFGGQYLSVDITDKYAFNPLPEKEKVLDGKEFDPDSLAYLILILERMLLDHGEVLNSAGESILEKAIKRSYEPLDAKTAPTLKDVRRCLVLEEGDAETKALAVHYANNLEMWAEGKYAKIFTGKKHLQTDSRLLVFDLENLSHHPRLQSVYFYVIREIIDAKLRDKSLRKMIVMDEGWRFFNDDIGSRLIENLYRTARKMNGMIFSISQSPLDFLNTKAANAIISNSYVKYVLRLTKGHDLLPQFDFNPREIEAIRNLSSVPRKFSDVFLKFNDHAATLRIEPCPLDYWICTTDADDTLQEEKLRKDHSEWSHIRVLQELARQGEVK